MDERQKALLPRHVRGELQTRWRQAQHLEQMIARHRAICEKDIDLTPWIQETSVNERLFDRWLGMQQDIDMFEYPGAFTSAYRFRAWSYISAWPTEKPRMFHQWAYGLGYRIALYGRATMGGRPPYELSVRNTDPVLWRNCLPNVNACQFHCPGDWSSMFQLDRWATRTQRINEFRNYIATPNLLENSMVTASYTRTVVAYAYEPIRVKKEGLEFLISPAQIWLELMKRHDEDESCLMREQNCNNCQYGGNTDWCRYLITDNIHRILARTWMLDIESLTILMDMKDVPRNAIINQMSEESNTRPCNSCPFHHTKPAEVQELIDKYRIIMDRKDKKNV